MSQDERPRDPARRLPEDVLALASSRLGELAWRRKDLPRLADVAIALDLACLGGQVQFRLPDAMAELYWQDFDPGEQKADEDWRSYVSRSWKEALFLAQGLPADDVLIEAARRFAGLQDRTDAELADALWFVTYLSAAPGLSR